MIRISCKNERFTYDMYHIVKSFLPDAEISQKVDPEQELLIEMTAEEEPVSYTHLTLPTTPYV